VQWLFDAGPHESGAMGRAALSWRGLAVWQRETGISLEPWQKRLLRRLSGEYLHQGDKAEKFDCPPPWQPDEMTPHSREVVSAKIAAVFGRLIKRQAEAGRNPA
jgi:hypothetical protein